MHKMTISGNCYTINNPKPFGGNAVDAVDVGRVVDFAYAMCFGAGHHRAHRSGGDLMSRPAEKFCNTFQGKLAEVCLRRELIQAGLSCDEPNFEIYGECIWDDTDLIVNGKALSVKSAASFSNLLLLESNDYDLDGNYVPNLLAGGRSVFDYYVLVRLAPDVKSLFKRLRIFYSDSLTREQIEEVISSCRWEYDVAGWISHDTLRSAISSGFVIPKGALLNGRVTMDADNYYVQAGDMADLGSLEVELSK